MKCYRCESSELSPSEIAPNLGAQTCADCEGIFVDLLAYRTWRDNGAPGHPNAHAEQSAEDGAATETVSEGKHALTCHKCQRLMLKYRIAADHPNYVDLCTHCDHAWLDGGEWHLLGQLDAQNKLTKIMTQPWQFRLRNQAAQDAREASYIDELGEPGVARVTEFVQWTQSLPDDEAVRRFCANTEFYSDHQPRRAVYLPQTWLHYPYRVALC